jgi:hypothetical protein
VPLVQRLTISDTDRRGMPEDPGVGDIVRAGHAGAVWRVGQVMIDGPTKALAVTLEPVDPHDVPLDALVRELPVRVPQLQGTLGHG